MENGRVECEKVSFSYRNKRVLNEVSWSIDGGVAGLLGPNGAGKTTLLSLVATLTRVQRGSIRIAGHDLSSPRERSATRALLGLVPQRFSLAAEMRVADTVAYAAWVNGVAGRDCPAAAETALAQLGLLEHARSRVRTLSGGQRQRLGIAAALAHDPRVLILDEPTVGLDPGQRLRVREMIANIGQDRTVLLASHLLEDIQQLCTRVGVLAEGRLVFDGDCTELTSLIQEADTGGTLGTAFERAYDRLISSLENES